MLHFDGDRTYSRSAAEVASKLSDARFLAQCIPGAEAVTVAEADHVVCTLRPGFAFVRGTLELTLRVIERLAGSSVRLHLHSKGIGTTSNVEASMELFIDHIGVVVRSLQESVPFYEALFGAPVQRVTWRGKDAEYVAKHIASSRKSSVSQPRASVKRLSGRIITPGSDVVVSVIIVGLMISSIYKEKGSKCPLVSRRDTWREAPPSEELQFVVPGRPVVIHQRPLVRRASLTIPEGLRVGG